MTIVRFLRLFGLAFALVVRCRLPTTSIVLRRTPLVPYVDPVLFLQSSDMHLAGGRLLGLVHCLLALGLVLLSSDITGGIQADGVNIDGNAVGQVLAV